MKSHEDSEEESLAFLGGDEQPRQAGGWMDLGIAKGKGGTIFHR
jgi:hypothetical protein